MLPQTKQIARYLNSLKTSSRMLAFYASCALGFTSQSAAAQEVQVSLSHQYGTTLLSPYNGTITATAPVGFNAIFENIPPLGANVGELRYSFRARYQLEPDLVESSRTLLEKSALLQLSVEPLGNLSAAREMQSISRELASLGFDMRRPDNAYWNDFIFHAPQLYRLHQTADNLLQNSLSDMHLEELASEAKAALSSEAAPAENSLLSYLVESSQLPFDTNQFGAEDILLAYYDVALHRLENGSAYQREWSIRSRPHGPNNLLPNSLALLNEDGIVQIILPRIRCLLPEYHAVGYEINAVREVGISCHSHIERSSAFRSLKVFGNYWQYKIDTGRYSFRDRVFLSTIAAARYRSIEVDEVSFAADGLGLEPSTTEQLIQSLSRSVVTGFGFLSSMGRPFSRNALGLYGASSVVDEPTYDLIAALLVNEAELAYDQLLQAEAAATLASCLPIGCNYAVLQRAGDPDELFKLFNPSIQRLLNVDAAWFQDFRKDTPRIKEIIEIAQSVVWASYTWERHSGFLPVVDNSSRQIRQAYMRGISSWVINEMRPGHRYQGSLLHVSEQPSVLALENAGTSNISSYGHLEKLP